MKIYYFSGTGNSFHVAKMIEKKITDSTVESIAEFRDINVMIDDKKVVIVCPIYFYGIPHIVKEFLEHLNFDKVEYFSFIFTAEYPNGVAVDMLQEICKRKNVMLNSCFYLKMPTNYIIKSKMLKPYEIERVLNKSEKKLDKIIEIIKKQKNHIEKDSKLYSIIVDAKKSYLKWEQIFSDFDLKFNAADNCSGCKLCEKHCPVGNITVNKKPSWNNHCEACLKCINICPRQAIGYNNETDGKIRYFNPEVKIDEF